MASAALQMHGDSLAEQSTRHEVCESCREYAAAEVNNVRLLAEEEMESLGLKLEQFEREAMYELEELQTELLEARADNEGLQQRLSESEHNRLQEQRLKKEVENQLLRLSEEAMLYRQNSEPPKQRSTSEGAVQCGDSAPGNGISRSSSAGLAEQPGTPDHQDQIASYPSVVKPAAAKHVLARKASGGGMEEIALALAQLREDFRMVTAELVRKKMELALSEEAMLNMVDKYEKRGSSKAGVRPRFPSLWGSRDS